MANQYMQELKYAFMNYLNQWFIMHMWHVFYYSYKNEADSSIIKASEIDYDINKKRSKSKAIKQR